MTVSMPASERIAKICDIYGTTARQAEFLMLAGLHGGYFLRRQIDEFLNVQPGGSSIRLLERSLAQKLIRKVPSCSRGHLFHIHAKPFYAALGSPDSRARRPDYGNGKAAAAHLIKRKLMALDYVLLHRDRQWLATEDEKVCWFEKSLRVSREALPRRVYFSHTGGPPTTRYFVDKQPIWTLSEGAGFLYLDPITASPAGFDTWLGDLRPLFAALESFQVVYVATVDLHFAAAERRFGKYLDALLRPPEESRNGHQEEQFRRYCEDRMLAETRQWGKLGKAGLDRLKQGQIHYASPHCEALYQRWKEAGDAVAEAPLWAPKGRLEFCRLRRAYGVLGGLLNQEDEAEK